MIISVDARNASVIADEQTAVFNSYGSALETAVAPASDPSGRSARATVEILRHAGGLMPRALIGGTFEPSSDPRLIVEVATSGPDLDGAATCVSQLAKPLVPGLPDEFVSSVVDGFLRRSGRGGRVVVDRAAFDPVESSPLAFELAAELLAVVLAARAFEGDVAEVVKAALEAWP